MATRQTMHFGEAVEIAAGSLWAHKLRSVLTLLGVVIGVSAVIAVVSFINGLNSYVAEKVFNLGADVFLITRGPIIPLNIDDYLEAQKRKKLTMEDYEAVRAACRSCQEVGAATRSDTTEVKFGKDYLRQRAPRLVPGDAANLRCGAHCGAVHHGCRRARCGAGMHRGV